MFHVKHVDGLIVAEYFGDDYEPDWHVGRRPDGSYWWAVLDWQGQTVACGVRTGLGEAVTECVRWSQ